MSPALLALITLIIALFAGYRAGRVAARVESRRVESRIQWAEEFSRCLLEEVHACERPLSAQIGSLRALVEQYPPEALAARVEALELTLRAAYAPPPPMSDPTQLEYVNRHE